MSNELLTPKELAGELLVPPHTLAQWRYQGRGPRFLKLEGHVRYRRSDVTTWEAECERGVPDAVA